MHESPVCSDINDQKISKTGSGLGIIRNYIIPFSIGDWFYFYTERISQRINSIKEEPKKMSSLYFIQLEFLCVLRGELSDSKSCWNAKWKNILSY